MRFLQIEKKLCKKIEKTFKYVLTSWIPYDIILIVELRNRQKSNKCECAGIGRQARLRGVCFTTYGFKSRHSHHRKDLIPCVSSLFYFMQASDDGTWGSLATAACGGKREQSAVWNKEHKEVHPCTTQCDYISDGERVTVKTKVDRRKQLLLGRALMKVWRWTSHISEVVSLTYSNHRHSQLPLQQIAIVNMTGLVFNHIIFCSQ